MIVCYQKELIPFIWVDVEKFIEKALKRGSVYKKEDIYQGLRESKLQLWADKTDRINAVLVTSIVDDYCLLLALAGKGMKEWLKYLRYVEQWAKAEGCKEMRIQGRKGWSRILGYEITGEDDLGLAIQVKAL